MFWDLARNLFARRLFLHHRLLRRSRDVTLRSSAWQTHTKRYQVVVGNTGARLNILGSKERTLAGRFIYEHGTCRICRIWSIRRRVTRRANSRTLAIQVKIAFGQPEKRIQLEYLNLESRQYCSCALGVSPCFLRFPINTLPLIRITRA